MDTAACSVPRCDTAAKTWGWCNAHYRQWKRSGVDPAEPVRCAECQVVVDVKNRGVRKYYCPPCLAARNRECNTRYVERLRASSEVLEEREVRRKTRLAPCTVCNGVAQQDERHARFTTTCSTECFREESRRRRAIWNAQNRAERAAAMRRRRTRKRAVSIEKVDAFGLWHRDEGCCGLCGDLIDLDLRYPHPDSLSIDHVIPLSKDGDHTWENTQPAHLTCNRHKGARVGWVGSPSRAA